MRVNYSDLCYIPKTEISRDIIRRELRVFGEQNDAPIVRDCFEDFGDYWGVARYWGMKKFPNAIDNTVCPITSFNIKKEFTPRHDQLKLIDNAEKILRDEYAIRIEAKTGYGKSAACLQLASRLDTPVLLVANQDTLLNQWTKEFHTWFDGDVCRIQATKNESGCDFSVATSQTLYSQRDKFDDEFWKQFGAIIVDEGNGFSAESFYTAINRFPARYRIAASATWRRKDGLEKLWDLAITPKVVIGKPVDNKIEMKYKVENLDYGWRTGKFIDFRTKRPDFNKLLALMAEHPEYNQWIADQVGLALEMGRNPLVVVKRTSQLEVLQDLLSDYNTGIFAGTFRGKSLKKKDLDEAREAEIILATISKIEKGVDIARLDTLLLACPVSDIEQVYGRICRMHPGKTDALAVDVRFPQLSLLNKGARSRDGHYKRLKIKKVK